MFCEHHSEIVQLPEGDKATALGREVLLAADADRRHQVREDCIDIGQSI